MAFGSGIAAGSASWSVVGGSNAGVFGVEVRLLAAVVARLGPANVLSEVEVRRVLGACRGARVGRPTCARNYALVMLLWRTGLRCAEALDLGLGDVRLEVPRLVRVRDGKGGVQRSVGCCAELAEALGAWCALRPRSPWLFCTLAGGRLDGGNVRSMLLAKGRRAGVARVHPHAFRATLAVELVREGCSLPVVRDVLGHSSIAVTDAYLRRCFPEDAVAALAAR